MRVIQTIAHIGPDGLLRLEVPVEDRNQDVQVALVVESVPSALSPADKWAASRAGLEAAGIQVPPAGVDSQGPIDPESLPGPPASEILIRDRR